MNRPVILASGSPRRKALLDFLLDEFEVIVPNVDETFPPGDIAQAMEAVAIRKAAAVSAPEAVVLAADTAVVLRGEVFGKPSDASSARKILQTLRGQDHHVITAVALTSSEGSVSFHERTTVRLNIPDAALESYLESNQWEGKAGAYGLQDAGLKGLATIDGSWSNVVGLPLTAVHSALMQLGVPCVSPPDESSIQLENPF